MSLIPDIGTIQEPEMIEKDTMIGMEMHQGASESFVPAQTDVALIQGPMTGGLATRADRSAVVRIFVETMIDGTLTAIATDEGILSRRLASRRPASPPPRPRGYSPGPSHRHGSRDHSPGARFEPDSPRSTDSRRLIPRDRGPWDRSDRESPARSPSPRHTHRTHSRSRSRDSVRTDDDHRNIKSRLPPRHTSESPISKQSPPPSASPARPRSRSRSPAPPTPSPLPSPPSPVLVIQEQHNKPTPTPASSRDKGKAKEEHDGDGDIKMKVEPPRSPPRNPKELERALRRRSRSPPTGPRHHLKTLTGHATEAPLPSHNLHEAGKSHGFRWTPNTGAQTRMDVDSPKVETPQSQLVLPPIPVYNPLAKSGAHDFTRLETAHAHVASDYVQNAQKLRRARIELEFATIDLRAAEQRREVADAQLEQARAGMLGIDATPVPVS
ncbi:hypothetical protein EW146_g988 [Bondarzewia mesenterica]|uniref:Uncharacterized protein n=1 Tax=Bondarzewia mesenterica TaxID=1095465 RepID=A0A4S4M5A2_9AGAM|nr:hypothetical protein EW146_g988 [Bondarzewia mesenterica]